MFVTGVWFTATVSYCTHREGKATTESSTLVPHNPPDYKNCFFRLYISLAEKIYDSNTYHDAAPNNLTKKYTADVGQHYFDNFAFT